MRPPYYLLAMAAVIAAPLKAQPTPNDLNQFGLICFCNSRIATPHYPIGLDNNGQLLFYARNGVTRETLAAEGVSFNESQIRMLRDWGVLREKAKVLTTAFPVLEPVAMTALRGRLQPVADRILPSLQPHARAIKQELVRRKQPEATYATLFSYVLDGLVWEELKSSDTLPKIDITVEKPFWAGTFWAVYPKQEQMPGTNARRKVKLSCACFGPPGSSIKSTISTELARQEIGSRRSTRMPCYLASIQTRA